MKRMAGGSTVPPGFYWNRGDWRIVTVNAAPGVLPGGAQDTYLRVPAAAMLALAPLLGLSFVVFLPFVGFAMVAAHLGRRGMDAARRVSARLAAEADEAPGPRAVRPPRAAAGGRSHGFDGSGR
jgi:hypothetical protein